jgi:5-methylcytosine-specific restriction protein A
MAYWLFKCNPGRYNLDARLLNPDPVITWTVSRYADEIRPGDKVFLWATGPDRGIRAVIRVDEGPRPMPERESEQQYWSERDESVKDRVVGTLIHRGLSLTADDLRPVPGLEQLAVFHGFQQATNLRVTDAEGDILMELVRVYESAERPSTPATPGSEARRRPEFVVGRVYNRRADIHAHFGGQQQGGIATPPQVSCVFLFTSPSGAQHGYEDGWMEDGVFRYTGEGQRGDMGFVRGNAAIRDHAVDGRDLHLFESQGKGEGYRYVGLFDCAGWEFRRGPDTAGHDRQVIVFHLVREAETLATNLPSPEPDTSSATMPNLDLAALRARAMHALRPTGDRSPRESRRLYYERSAAVRDYVLARAKGTCECCRRAAPFRRPDGSPYLEPHHTRRVADGGPDHPRWVGAVCPNCHREVHYGENGANLNQDLEAYLGGVEQDA